MFARIAGPVLLGVTVLSGCSYGASSTVAPTATTPITPQSSSTPLTVLVLTRGSETPVPGAAVARDDQSVGETGSDGAIRTVVPVGKEFHITVAASGFLGNGAWGTVEGEERWTFYLERAQ